MVWDRRCASRGGQSSDELEYRRPVSVISEAHSSALSADAVGATSGARRGAKRRRHGGERLFLIAC